MPKLDTPTGLALCDPYTGREPNRLCIVFDEVEDATSYTLLLNSVPWPDPVTPNTWIGPLAFNTAYSISIIASANGFEDSDPVVPMKIATRPPTPQTLQRAPVDLHGWGIVFDWAEPGGWSGDIGASVILRRSDAGNLPSEIAMEEVGVPGRYIDTRYPLNIDKIYDLIITAPDPVGGGRNESFPGPPISAKGPFKSTSLGATNQLIEINQKRSERYAHRLLGLPY